ncbi:hypothetical protein UPYG_G00309820 [Umbra pygmaea]|uniref:Protein phosphatase 1 regulatory subunit 1C n=1 Tax=Umbra pygmaea TaxID=75934 RepID=A0ABD0W122_UMBPY
MESNVEANSPKKIHFAVPAVQSQLDAQASEHIRKRRPTPATHVIYLPPDLAAPDDKQLTRDQAETWGSESSPAQRKHSVYTAPTMTDCCRGLSEDRPNQTDKLALAEELLSGALPCLTDTPRRKDTPYQQQSPFTPGVKMLKSKSKVSFPEDEEEKDQEMERKEKEKKSRDPE